MSKDPPKDNPPPKPHKGSFSQTDEPWKGNPEKEQKRTGPPPDLEKWRKSGTH